MLKIFESRNPPVKFTALFLSLLLLVTSTQAYAQEISAARLLGQAEVIVPAWIDRINIPREIGSVDARFQSASPDAPVIVHIQDAHGQWQAQRQIEQVLFYLQRNFGFKTLFLEGGLKGKISSDLLRFFSEESLNRELAGLFLKAGEIGGAEEFILMSGRKVQAYGVEQGKLYKRNLFGFRKVYAYREQSNAFLNDLKALISSYSSHSLRSDLRHFLQSWLHYQDSKSDILSHLKVLSREAQKHLRLDLHDARNQFDYPQLLRFFKLEETEQKLKNQSAAFRKEKNRLKAWLIARQLTSARSVLLDKILDQNLSHPDPELPADLRSFLEDFYLEAHPQGFSFRDYPVLSLYFGGAVLRQELDSAKIFSEIEQINNGLLEHLARSPEEKRFVRLFKDYLLLKQLFSLELTRKSFQEVKQNTNDLFPSSVSGRLQEFRQEKSNEKIKGTVRLDSLFREAIHFYEVATQRENAIFSNLLGDLKQRGITKAVLITGGFHSEGLYSLLQKSGLSYVSVTPRMTEIQENQNYLDRMMLRGRFEPFVSALPQTSPGRIPLPTMAREISLRDARYHQNWIHSGGRLLNGTFLGLGVYKHGLAKKTVPQLKPAKLKAAFVTRLLRSETRSSPVSSTKLIPVITSYFWGSNRCRVDRRCLYASSGPKESR